jgi:pilus assembly protein Flp/PilA
MFSAISSAFGLRSAAIAQAIQRITDPSRFFTAGVFHPIELRRSSPDKVFAPYRCLMANLIAQFAGDESGATSIEYALIAVLVAIAIIGSVSALGSSLQSIFNNVSSEVSTAVQQ